MKSRLLLRLLVSLNEEVKVLADWFDRQLNTTAPR